MKSRQAAGDGRSHEKNHRTWLVQRSRGEEAWPKMRTDLASVWRHVGSWVHRYNGFAGTTYQYLNSRPCWPLAEPRKITGKWLEVKEGDGLLRITLIILLLLLCSLALLLCVWHCLDWTQLDNTVSSTHQRKSFQSFPFFGVSSTSSAQSRTAW